MTLPDADRLHRAKGYPYTIPPWSFRLEAGVVHPMSGPADIPDRERRTPVIATGSNLSPDRLKMKYSTNPAPIPVVRATLGDFDSVYSAHVTSYGSIASTPFPSPGTRVTVAVLWLTKDELKIMHETESLGMNYTFGRLDGLDLTLEGSERLETAYSYVGRRGALGRNGQPVPLAAIAAENRRWPALDQVEVLSHVRDLIAPGAELDPFILAAIVDDAERSRRTTALAADSRAFSHPTFTPMIGG